MRWAQLFNSWFSDMMHSTFEYSARDHRHRRDTFGLRALLRVLLLVDRTLTRSPTERPDPGSR